MAQQHINYGAFPDDVNADAIRAAFEKVENNFNDLYTGAATSGVSKITAGPGIVLQGNTLGTGNVSIAAALNSVNIVTDVVANNLIISGSPLRSGTSAISINVNTDNFRVNNLDVNNALTINGLEAFSYDAANSRITLGNSITPVDGSHIQNIIPQPYANANAGITPAAGQVQFVRNIANANVVVGSNAFVFDNTTNTASVTSLITSEANITSFATILGALVQSNSDSNTGNALTGALRVSGGVGIFGSITAGNTISSNNVSNHTFYGVTNIQGALALNGNSANALGEGTLVLNGTSGASVGGNLFVGQNSNITGNFAVASTDANSIRTAGGANILTTLWVGGAADIRGDLSLSGSATLQSDANIVGNVEIGGDLSVNANITGSNLTANLNLEVGGYANIGANISAGANLAVGTDITAGGNATIFGNASINGTTQIAGDTRIISPTTSVDPSSGALVISGGVGIGDNLYVANNIIAGDSIEVANVSDSNAYVTITGDFLEIGANTAVSAKGANTEIQFNNTGNLAGHANLTYNSSNSTLRTGNIQFINGITSTDSTISITTTTANLRNTNVTGNITVSGNIAANGNITANGTISGTNGNFTGNLAGTLTTAAQPNITSLGTLTALTVNGAVSCNTISVSSGATIGSTGTDVLQVNGEIRATSDIVAFYASDTSFKENIRPIKNALEKACSIRGYQFDWSDKYLNARGGVDEYFNVKQSAGVIAQDVQAVMPELVRTKPDGTLAVDYPKLTSLALAAIYELKQELQQLKEKDSK